MTSEALQKWQLELPGIISSTRVTPEGLILSTAPNKLRALALLAHSNIRLFSVVLYFTMLLALGVIPVYYLHEAQELANAVQELQKLKNEILDLKAVEIAVNSEPSGTSEIKVETATRRDPDLRTLVVFLAVIAFIASFGPAGMPLFGLFSGPGTKAPQAEPQVEVVDFDTAEELNAMYETLVPPFLSEALCAAYGISPEITRDFFTNADMARQSFILSCVDSTQTMRGLSEASTEACLKMVQNNPQGYADLLVLADRVKAEFAQQEALRAQAAHLFTARSDAAIRNLFIAANATNETSIARFSENVLALKAIIH